MAEEEHDSRLSAEAAALIESPWFIQSLETVKRIAGFDIPVATQAVFMRFQASIAEPQPAYIGAWRADPAQEKWYHWHVNGILSNVRGALAAAHYHRTNLAQLEDELVAALNAIDFSDSLGNSTFGMGGTRKLDFEYQSFILACRRALDYLAGALAAYFKTESNSFRSLPKAMKTKKPAVVSDAIKEAHSRHLADLHYIMAEGRRSVRNRIAHYEFVSAGTINISRQGLFLVGGGEELRTQRDGSHHRLDEALGDRLDRLHACVEDMIDSFMTAERIS